MLAQTLATGDNLYTGELHRLPAGTMVKSLGNSGWWEVTELPQVEALSERDQFAEELGVMWMAEYVSRYSKIDAWRKVADYVLANSTPAEAAVDEVAADEGVDAQVVDYPERVRDCDGDLWKLVSSSGRYSWVGAVRGEINLTNRSLADLVTELGPISAE